MSNNNSKNILATETKIISKIINTPQLSDEAEALDGIFAFKTFNHEIVHCNQNFLEYIGFKTVDSVVGKTDFDLSWQQYTHIYHGQEDDALQGKLYSALHPGQDSNGRKLVFFNRKFPWMDEEGKVIGIASYSIEVDNPNLVEVTSLLNSTAIHESETDHILCDKFSDLKLTRREAECLFYLLHGKTSKQIADVMEISPRTVESYIEGLKLKFNCNSKPELFDFCVKNGFVKIVPAVIFSKKLINILKE